MAKTRYTAVAAVARKKYTHILCPLQNGRRKEFTLLSYHVNYLHFTLAKAIRQGTDTAQDNLNHTTTTAVVVV